jgi:hypothetical protein
VIVSQWGWLCFGSGAQQFYISRQYPDMEGDEKRFNEEIKTRVKTVKYLLSGVIK